MSPAPSKFQLPIAQEGMVYKICDSVYKIVQNKYKIMLYFSFSKSVLGVAGDMYLLEHPNPLRKFSPIPNFLFNFMTYEIFYSAKIFILLFRCRKSG